MENLTLHGVEGADGDHCGLRVQNHGGSEVDCGAGCLSLGWSLHHLAAC